MRCSFCSLRKWRSDSFKTGGVSLSYHNWQHVLTEISDVRLITYFFFQKILVKTSGIPLDAHQDLLAVSDMWKKVGPDEVQWNGPCQ